MPSMRSTIIQRVDKSKREETRQRVTVLTIIDIFNQALKVVGATLINKVQGEFQLVLLPISAKPKIHAVFQNTIIRTRDGGSFNSKAGLGECRRIFEDELNILSNSANVEDNLGATFIHMLDLSSPAQGGRPIYFNICPTYDKSIATQVDLFNGDGVFSEGEYQNNVGYGVPLAYALIHFMGLVKLGAIIPQVVERSILVIVKSKRADEITSRHDLSGDCSFILSEERLSYFDEASYDVFKQSQDRSKLADPQRLDKKKENTRERKALDQSDIEFSTLSFIPSDKVRFLKDPVFTEESEAASSILNCLKAPTDQLNDIVYARGYGKLADLIVFFGLFYFSRPQIDAM